MSKITEPGEPAISANGVDRRGAKIDLREWMQTDPMEQLRKDRENELAAMEPEDRKRLLIGSGTFTISGKRRLAGDTARAATSDEATEALRGLAG